MNRFTRPARLLILVLLSLAVLPVGAFAAQVATETVTIQVNITTPGGTSIIGTAVAHRRDTTPITADLSFTGMVNGVLTRAEGTATEVWTSDGEARIVISNLRTLSGAAPKGLISYSKHAAPAAVIVPTELIVNLLQLGPNLVSVNGVPVAMDGLMVKPFSGRTNYTVTMAGQGSAQVLALPRTGGGLFLDPLLIVGLLVVSGLALVGLSSLVRKVGPSTTLKH